MNDVEQRFLSAIERAGIPVVAIAYAVGVALSLRQAFDRLGLRLLSLVSLLAATIWCVYVWVANRPSPIQPSHVVRRFERGPRLLALASAVAMLLPTWYALRPTGPEIPYLMVKIQNNSEKSVQINSYGECYFSAPESPKSEPGRVRIIAGSGNGKPITYVVPGHGFSFFAIRFLNTRRVLPLLNREDVALEIVIRTNDGRELRQRGIPFARDELNQYVELTLN
jgi:hypothetical protein